MAKVSDRYLAVAAKYTPAGYAVKYRRSLTGLCWYAPKCLIETPKPVTARALAIYLHECAHARLKHDKKGGKSIHRIEYEAEFFFIKAFQHEGLIPHPKSIQSAKQHVARKITQALRRKAKRIDREAAVFAWGQDAEAQVALYGAVLE